MKEDKKWKKWPIGKIHGHSVYIELPPDFSGAETEQEWNSAALYLEQSFRNNDFLEEMREFFSPPHIESV